MKRYSFAFLCFVALTSAATLNAAHTKYYKIDDPLLLGPIDYDQYEDNILKCELETNDGSKFTLYPTPKEGLDRRFDVYEYSGCQVYVRQSTEKDQGIWKVIATVQKYDNNTTQTITSLYNIQIRKSYDERILSPATQAYAYVDQQVSVHFNEKFNDLASCKLLNPAKEEYTLESNKSANITLSNECGFKIKVETEQFAGEWTLIADLKNGSTFHGNFNLKVKNKNDLSLIHALLYLKRGEPANIDGGRRFDQAKMCILENPHGIRYPINTGSCSHYIPFVREYHEGIWKAFYGFDGIERLVEQQIVVHTYDDVQLRSNVSRSNNGINLLCQVHTHSIKFCSFIKPDGEILHMTFAVGNDKYSYYGNGVHNSDNYVTDCGVTIHNPTFNDYGAWKCLIRISSSETLGTILKVSEPAKSNIIPKSIVQANDVYAKSGDSYTIKCSADEVLSYCWLRSPNGSVHNVYASKDVNLPTLQYTGSGFELGECMALIPKATKSDAGKWTCHMGVSNGPELQVDFKVTIKETYLMAARELAYLDKSSTDLVCLPLPDSNKIIDSCRWITPQGHGINVDVQGRYITTFTGTSCRLTIHVVNYDEDVGKWSCHARFIEKEGVPNYEEGNASIIVTYRSMGIGNFLSIGLFIGLLVFTTLALFVIIAYKRRLTTGHCDEKIIFPKQKPPKYP